MRSILYHFDQDELVKTAKKQVPKLYGGDLAADSEAFAYRAGILDVPASISRISSLVMG